MSKIKVTLSGFIFLLVLLFGLPRVDSRNPDTKNNHNGYAPSGTLQKMIVENASVTMQVDLNGLNGSNSLVARPVTCTSPRRPILSFPFSFLTICCVGSSRVRWLLTPFRRTMSPATLACHS